MKTVTIPKKLYLAQIEGVIREGMPFVAEHCIRQGGLAVNWVLLPRAAMLESFARELQSWQKLHPAQKSRQIVILPTSPSESANEPLPARLREEMACDRLTALTLLGQFAEKTPADRQLIVLTTPQALFEAVPARENITLHEIQLRVGEEYAMDELRRRLAEDLDYDAEAVCEYPGQYSVRGGLLDVYPLNGSHPVRLDFFGDELESIRSFDPTTQRSIDSLGEVLVAPRLKPQAATNPANILEYLGSKMLWLLLEPDEMFEEAKALFSSFERLSDQRFTFEALFKERLPAKDTWLTISELPPAAEVWSDPAYRVACNSAEVEASMRRSPEGYVGIERMEQEDLRRTEVLQWAKLQFESGAQVKALFSGEAERSRFEEILAEKGMGSDWLELRVSEVNAGFHWKSYKAAKVVSKKLFGEALSECIVLTERELLGRNLRGGRGHQRRQLPHRTAVDQLLDFSELADGDYLVHIANGVCIFRGLTTMTVRGRDEEVISLEFDERVTLHLPLSESHLLTRYIGLSKMSPRLGNLSSNQWEKSRQSAEKATLDYAAEMLKIQAVRSQQPGHAFSADTEWQQRFEAAFPYRETPDQMKAILAAKADMESDKPADRLICGDVGFGKTEVAIRAAFKAVMDGYQVVLLCPTTILAQQHYQTFRDRMADYPVTVEMISRFRSARQQKEILKQVKAGSIDILIGTHRVLSKDVSFRQLGLLVIDEEHRFGVRHKERLKHLRSHVDILAMSATPIPRTLYLALMGARDMSVIETPPEDRLPIETVVRGYDPKLVREAIRRELDRAGQVFYLHNRVQSIDSVAEKLLEWFPKARIAIGHGQMTENTLEKVMTQFAAGEIDILVCTTIIENGLDIPNCNTILIESADRFGLSQLYQLRGRVGRFNRQAYAYLLLHRHARLLNQARERLSAMRQHNQLGAGFRIAMRDLELRGAGNLLGSQQSGHIAAVGFELYCQLLRHSISRLKGEEIAAHIRASVVLDFIYQGRSTDRPQATTGFQALQRAEWEKGRIEPERADLPAAYIPEPRLRMVFYRQLANCDLPDQADAVAAELKDRFGKIPIPAKRLIAISRIRTIAQKAGVQSVVSEGDRLKCLRAGLRKDDYLKIGNQFPRLTTATADLRLREIEHFLLRSCPL
jgi:transcription-repair coupling factor (superfamily II helicase)